MALTNAYATLAQVKSSLRIGDDLDDELIELAIESASREIDQTCERVFYQLDGETRLFAATDSFVCEIDDLRTITTLKTSTGGEGVFDTTWDLSKDAQLEPLNGFAGGIPHPFTRIRAVDDYLFPLDGGEALVQVTGDWGWQSVPVAVTQATVILASRIYKRNDSPLGVAGFGDLGAIRVSAKDPDVYSLIAPFMKVRMG